MKHRNPHPSPYQLERAVADCHDWLTSHDVIAAALGAFYAAQRQLDHPDNFPVCKRGQGRSWMAEEMTYQFELLIQDLGYRHQVPGFTSYATEILKSYRADTRGGEQSRETGFQGDTQESSYKGVIGGVQSCHKSVINDLSTNPQGQSNENLSQRRHDIHRRASQNGKTED